MSPDGRQNGTMHQSMTEKSPAPAVPDVPAVPTSPDLLDNEPRRADRAFLKEMFHEYSAWARHFHDQSTKVNLILVLISGAIIGLVGDNIKPIHGLLLMILSVGAILSTAACWASYQYNKKLAAKIRKSFVEQDFFSDRVLDRAERTFQRESPILSKMRLRNQYVYWLVIHMGTLLIGAFGAFGG